MTYEYRIYSMTDREFNDGQKLAALLDDETDGGWELVAILESSQRIVTRRHLNATELGPPDPAPR